MSSTTVTTTATKTISPKSLLVVATGRVAPYAQLRSESAVTARRTQRRLSAPSTNPPPLKHCNTVSYSLEALDLSPSSPTQTLASIRFLVLSYLADLERRLAQFESPDLEAWKVQGELTIEDAKQWARTALEMLNGIRADVYSHLPESMESFVKSHLPDIPDVPNFKEMRSHLPEMPYLPDMTEMRSHLPDIPSLPDMTEMRSHIPSLPDMEGVRSHLSDMRLKLDDVRTRLQDLDFQKPLQYIPTLSQHLQNLHSHLSSLEFPSGFPAAPFPPNTGLTDLVESVLNSDVVKDILNATPEVIIEGEDLLERAAYEVTSAVKRSLQGVHLISYSDLPSQWRNNPFVTHGYRFIPIERWPLILMSLFAFHNETLNIHTHLIPFLMWGISLFPFVPKQASFDTPELLFMGFALLCLLSSALWHTMSGCADHKSMEFCARVDYVGIGWLISASIGTVVHYGLQCHPEMGYAFLGLCFTTGLAGNIFPFMAWFNKREYRFYRIGFFLALAFSGIGPMIAISYLHGAKEMFEFVGPVFPSLVSYVVGLVFYAYHFPECIIPPNIQRRLDAIGGVGSHAIWHCFIVLAVSQHKTAIGAMKGGMQCFV
ncbi:hemolysin-III related-domain-containing protein [Gymnopilus junonius]|uniref:Hemolysin-III related-domain-containing protein n=1 Tax=Gymnopilus junonius TaxID=109634 RepID=A0A9P5NQJ3_GYMJU|nr:hemolysin-III related-domain-containing protein [Gymnopilus junonius]